VNISSSTTTSACREGYISGTASGYSQYRLVCDSSGSSTMNWAGMVLKTS
jgi:hypothetical protein